MGDKVDLLIVDGSAFQGDHRNRGISRYIGDLVESILDRGDITIWLRTVDYLRPISLRHPFASLTASDSEIIGRLTRSDPSSSVAYLMSSPFQGELNPPDIAPRWLSQFGIPLIGLVYDVIPALFAGTYLPEPELKRSYFARLELLKTGDSFVAISESAGDDFARLTGVPRGSIHTIGTGINLRRFSPEAVRRATSNCADFLTTLGWPSRQLVVYVAGEDFRKNVPHLLRAWRMLHRSRSEVPRLVVVCNVPDSVQSEWNRIANANCLTRRDVTFTGSISDDKLIALYGAALFQVFPSRYEGFGLPIAEAAACGLPTIAGDNSSLPEVLGPEICRFDSTNYHDIARAILEVLDDESQLVELSNHVAAKRESLGWHPVSQRFAEHYHSIKRPAFPQQIRVDRVAIIDGGVGSLSPYFLRETPTTLLSGLPFEVSCFGEKRELDRAPNHPVFPLESYGRLLRNSDFRATLVSLSNSNQSIGALKIAQSFPTTVILNTVLLDDLFPKDLFKNETREATDAHLLVQQILAESALGRINRPIDSSRGLDFHSWIENGISFSEGLGMLVRSLIVPNDEMALLLKAALYPRAPVIEAIPPPCAPSDFPGTWADRVLTFIEISGRGGSAQYTVNQEGDTLNLGVEPTAFAQNQVGANSELIDLIQKARFVLVAEDTPVSVRAAVETCCLDSGTPFRFARDTSALKRSINDQISSGGSAFIQTWEAESLKLRAKAESRSRSEFLRRISAHLVKVWGLQSFESQDI